MFPIWAYLLVAAAIALVAFGTGQIAPGAGMIFVMVVSTNWAAYSVRRGKRLGGGR
ncbi:hypothetical protein [uncultured Sphingomonas sp.]|uniref:hypothetical protein n=1 Tax=uncultured Sphingomonas sp. TaxID=158754 RepID=UPI0035CA1388